VKKKNTWAPAQAIPKSNKKNWRFMQLTISVIWTWYERINHRRLKIYAAHNLSNPWRLIKNLIWKDKLLEHTGTHTTVKTLHMLKNKIYCNFFW
jgi:hypothetical protein